MSGDQTATRMNRVSPNRGKNRPVLCNADFMTSEKVRVVVGDDHPLFRDGVVRALTSSGSIEVVAEADDGVSALEAIRTHSPQVALLDYRMPGMDGAEVAAAVQRDELPTRVLLVSAHDESAIVYRALQEGAAGFLPKESTRSELVNAVLNCAKGRDIVAPNLAAGLVGEIRSRAEPDRPGAQPARAGGAEADRRGQQHPRDGQGAVTWRRRRSRPTCNGSTRNSASAIAPPPSPRRCAASSWSSVARPVQRIRRVLRGGTRTRLGDSAAAADRPDRRPGVDLGGRPLAARAVCGDPRCVRGGSGAVAGGRAARAGAPVGRIGRRRPSTCW